jgi:hypothetical protein
MPITT